MEYSFIVDANNIPSRNRLDKFLTEVMTAQQISRSQLQRLIKSGNVTIDGNICYNNDEKLTPGCIVVVKIEPAQPTELLPVEMSLEILFEDEHVVVINKPAGLTVHPAVGERNPTLVHALLHHCGNSLSGIGGIQRPGIVHRLDKDTSGAIIVAKHDAAHQSLAKQLQERSLSRIYHAIAYGIPRPNNGTVDAPIARCPKNRKKMAVVEGGKAARTYYKLMRPLAEHKISFLECKLETGRTHQIRVHLHHIGHPLVGDSVYGRSNNYKRLASADLQKFVKCFTRQALHAYEISFNHPQNGKQISCVAPYPQDFTQLLAALDM